MTAGERRFRRPAFLTPESFDELESAELDPAARSEIAHETAAILLRTGRGADDPLLVDRLVSLVDDIGLSTLARLWADRPATSLPGALWRLYVVREWVGRAGVQAARDYRQGLPHAEVAGAVAGVATPPGPDEVRHMVDEIMHGVFDGDFGVALHRAAAFCRVVSSGRAGTEPDDAVDGAGEEGLRHARSAAALFNTARDLEVCARLWDAGDLV